MTSNKIDLAQFDEAISRHDQGLNVPIFGPDGRTPSGLVVRVAGPDSAKVVEARAVLQRKLVESRRLDPLTPQEVSRQGAEFLALITIGWFTPEDKPATVLIEGKELSFSVENAILVYERYRFIRSQVDNASGNRQAFLTASPGSSATPSAST